MIELYKLIFDNFWAFTGTVILIAITLSGISEIIDSIKGQINEPEEERVDVENEN